MSWVNEEQKGKKEDKKFGVDLVNWILSWFICWKFCLVEKWCIYIYWKSSFCHIGCLDSNHNSYFVTINLRLGENIDVRSYLHKLKVTAVFTFKIYSLVADQHYRTTPVEASTFFSRTKICFRQDNLRHISAVTSNLLRYDRTSRF